MKVDGSNSVAKTNNNGANKPATLKQWVAKMTDQIAMALPANITPERMARKLFSLAKAKHPDAVCTVGWQYKLFLFLGRLVPTTLAYKIVGKMY